MTELVVPTVLNDTSKADVLESLINAYKAVDNAIVELTNAAPHWKDYYMKGSAEYLKVAEQHGKRIKMLVKVSEELRQIAEAVDAQ